MSCNLINKIIKIKKEQISLFVKCDEGFTIPSAWWDKFDHPTVTVSISFKKRRLLKFHTVIEHGNYEGYPYVDSLYLVPVDPAKADLLLQYRESPVVTTNCTNKTMTQTTQPKEQAVTTYNCTVVVIKDNVVDEVVSIIGNDYQQVSDDAEKKFLSLCETNISNWNEYTEEDKQDILMDGYVEKVNGSVCISWPLTYLHN